MHYICIGECGRVSDTQDVCKAEYCSQFNISLKECICSDNKHEELMKKCEKCGKLCKAEGGCEIIET